MVAEKPCRWLFALWQGVTMPEKAGKAICPYGGLLFWEKANLALSFILVTLLWILDVRTWRWKHINVMNCRPLLPEKNKSSIIGMQIDIHAYRRELAPVPVVRPVRSWSARAVILENFWCLCLSHEWQIQVQVTVLNHLADYYWPGYHSIIRVRFLA